MPDRTFFLLKGVCEMTQIIVVEEQKKMTIFNVAESYSTVAKGLESGEWVLPDSEEKHDFSKMCMLQLPNCLVLLPRDYQWSMHTNDEESQNSISPRQREVVQALAEGFTTKQIAYKLGISQRTVMAHIQATKERFGTYTRAQTVGRAMSLGLIQAG